MRACASCCPSSTASPPRSTSASEPWRTRSRWRRRSRRARGRTCCAIVVSGPRWPRRAACPSRRRPGHRPRRRSPALAPAAPGLDRGADARSRRGTARRSRRQGAGPEARVCRCSTCRASRPSSTSGSRKRAAVTERLGRRGGRAPPRGRRGVGPRGPRLPAGRHPRAGARRRRPTPPFSTPLSALEHEAIAIYDLGLRERLFPTGLREHAIEFRGDHLGHRDTQVAIVKERGARPSSRCPAITWAA